MFKKALKDSSIVFLSICVASCSLQTFDNSNSGPTNKIPLSDDLYNPEPAITPSFVDSPFCTGDFGDLPVISIYSPTNGARDLCSYPPSDDLRGLQFASLNVASRTSVGTRRNNKNITLEAAYAGLSPYIDHSISGDVNSSVMRDLFHTIAADLAPTFRTPSNCSSDGETDQDCVERARSAHQGRLGTFNRWSALDINERLPYMGISIVDWNNVAYHLTHHVNAYEVERAEKRARRRRYLGIFVAVILTVATAGAGTTLGASFGASLSSIAAGSGASMALASVAFKAGVALGGMVVAAGISAFTTFIVTGDIKAAFKALGAVFKAKLEDAIIGYIASMVGISPSVANAAVDSYKSGDSKEALQQIGMEIVGQHGHDVLQNFVDEENGINGFEAYIQGLAKVVDGTENTDMLKDKMAEYTANTLGGYVSSFLHITSPKGIEFVSRMVNQGIEDGKFDAEALRGVFVDTVKDSADELPDFIKEKLGGQDNAEGIFSDVVADSLLETPEEIDKAKEKLEKFIDGLKEKYDWDPAIGHAASEEVSKLYDHIKANGIGQNSVQSYLSDHYMVEHLVTTYTSDNVAQNGFLTAIEYADKHNLDREQVEKAMMEDVVQAVDDANIPDEIAHVFGSDEKIISEFQTSFSTRLAYHRSRNRTLTTEQLLEKALGDLDNYGEKFADGFVGTYDAAMISATLGDNVDSFLRDMTNLYAEGNQPLAVRFFKDNLLIPLGDANIDLETFDNEEIMDIIQSGINVLLSKGTPPQMLDAMGSALAFYSRQDLCQTCN